MSDLDVAALAASLAETVARLDEHIARRAREIADPEIRQAAAQVRAVLDEQAQEREASERRLADLRDEIARQRRAWDRQMLLLEAERDHARTKLAEYEAVRAAVTKGDRLDLDRPLTVSDVLVAHDVTRKALADALDVGYHLNWVQLVAYAESQRIGLHGRREPNGLEPHRVRFYPRKPGHVPTYSASHPAACDGLPYGEQCWFDALAETALEFRNFEGWPEAGGEFVAHAPAEGKMHIRFEPINEEG